MEKKDNTENLIRAVNILLGVERNHHPRMRNSTSTEDTPVDVHHHKPVCERQVSIASHDNSILVYTIVRTLSLTH